MNVLKKHLAERKTFLGDSDVRDLAGRKKEEIGFHNVVESSVRGALAQGNTGNPMANKKFYATTELSHKYIEDWLYRNVKDKVFLDFACGEGQMTVKAAEMGATLAIGIDLSDQRIRAAMEHASRAGVRDRCFFFQADCENTELPEACVDVILCSGMLHHLDLSCAYPELKRILAPGGKVFAVEALAHNPFIRLYRKLTPQLRTSWEAEHIIGMKDIRFAKQFFTVGEMRFWHFTSPLTAYLHRALRGPALIFCNQVDRWLSQVPGLRLWAWQITFELHKPR